MQPLLLLERPQHPWLQRQGLHVNLARPALQKLRFRLQALPPRLPMRLLAPQQQQQTLQSCLDQQPGCPSPWQAVMCPLWL